MGRRLTARERLDRAIPEEQLRVDFAEAAGYLGWRFMHISDSRKVVRRDGKDIAVGDEECKGWPDLFLAHPRSGRLLAVEVKRELEKVTPEQQAWLDDLAACGVATFVLRPSTWDEGEALLREPRR